MAPRTFDSCGHPVYMKTADKSPVRDYATRKMFGDVKILEERKVFDSPSQLRDGEVKPPRENFLSGCRYGCFARLKGEVWGRSTRSDSLD